jgi:GNAT superfamily N-acetyltransferase
MGDQMTSTRAATALGTRVRLAHADAWQVEGRARLAHGGGAHAVRGARLMASGLPTPKWNNADIEALDVDLQTMAAWYAARNVPWGVRVPAGWDLPIGQPVFTKRCFGRQLTAALPPPIAGGIQVQRAGVADFDAYVATDAAVFGDDPVLTGQWVAPVLGASRFAHWLARADGTPVGVACTVRSDERAGPAVMVTGVGVLPPWRGQGIEKQLLQPALWSAFAGGAMLAHAYASDADEAEFLQASGFLEVPALVVRVVRPV